MRITIVGFGCGAEETLTRLALSRLREAELVLGAPRLLDALPADWLRPGCRRRSCSVPEEIAETLARSGAERACVLMSGDSGFYSGTRLLLPLLPAGAEVLPGISSVQALAARLGRPWQDWGLYSAHGADCDAVAAVCRGRPAFFLTGGRTGPGELCAQLAGAGLGFLPVTAGENLFLPDERITSATAGELAGRSFAGLSVLLAEAAPRWHSRVPGLPDSLFERAEGVPMTKQEVRAAALAKLAIGPEDLCWDVGAGSGSVGIEMAMHARAVYAVERRPEALALARRNRERLGAWNLRLAEGSAPEALEGLPPPDAVFVGGSGGALKAILAAALRANPRARLCVSAIALETLHAAFGAFRELGLEAEAAQLAVSRTATAGGLHLLLAHNPVFLLTGTRP